MDHDTGVHVLILFQGQKILELSMTSSVPPFVHKNRILLPILFPTCFELSLGLISGEQTRPTFPQRLPHCERGSSFSTGSLVAPLLYSYTYVVPQPPKGSGPLSCVFGCPLVGPYGCSH